VKDEIDCSRNAKRRPEEGATMENRLLGADFMRALACLMVLTHHLTQRLSPFVVPDPFRPAFEWGLLGSFGVSAFFVLSGFLLSRPFWQAYDAGGPMPSLRTYAMRRAARILPGFWLALTVSFLLSFTLFGIYLDQSLAIRYLAGFLLISDFHYVSFFPVEVNGPLWSIGMEVGSYILLPMFLAVMFLLRPWARPGWGGRLVWLGVIGIVVGAHFLIVRYWPMDNDMRGWDYGIVGGAKLWMPRFNTIGFFAIFAIGALAGGIQVRFAQVKHWVFDLGVVLGFAVAIWSLSQFVRGSIMEGWGFLSIPYGFPWFPIGVGIVLAAAPSSRIAGWLLDNPPARYVAKISFGIYVWHFVLMEVIRHNWYNRFWPMGGVQNLNDWLVLSAVVIGVTFLIAHVSYNTLEAPIIAWARTREKRQPREPEPEPATRPGF
jgi:peptidoglycan/LPS O-acetylase OafA/YrhL